MMVKYWIPGGGLLLGFCMVFIFRVCYSEESNHLNTFTVSSFTYSTISLKPYDWRYIRVELPPWFSSLSIYFESDVDLDLGFIRNANSSTLPMICFREGSPPLPDVYSTSLAGLVVDYISNGSFIGNVSLQNFEKCYPMQKNIRLTVTNEQISSGTWYFGLFNGIGPLRTQSKMINRGSGYSFSGNITVEGCTTSMMAGQFCNETVGMISCNTDYTMTRNGIANSLSGNLKNAIACRYGSGIVCHESYGSKSYILDIVRISEMLIIVASNVTFNNAQTSNTTNSSTLMCYVRFGAMPTKNVFDFSGDISKFPLGIHLPKAGRWYITTQPEDISDKSEGTQANSFKACYLLELQVFQCPEGKAGFNCTLQRHVLQTVRKNSYVPYEFHYVPLNGKGSQDSANFPLEPLVSNFSSLESAWTFFVLEVPSAAAGGNIRLRLTSDVKLNYEIYSRFGALPAFDQWDYYYANNTRNSNGSMFFKLYDSSEKKVDFYLLYVKGGTWTFGLRQFFSSNSTSQTFISISLERCPRKCSSHGTCQSVLDTSGLALYSYCACDRNHGGFDCSIEIVSHQGHIKQSIFLIASNAAAILPAYWALRKKAFAEWVLFTSSGISSALYHACDVGTWCPLSFRVLQFLDFWLSFMAVVSTFVYLSSITEVSKRTIHTIVAIITALMAITGPTRSSNIIIVLFIGAAGLLLGLLMEICTRFRSLSFRSGFHLNLNTRWESLKGWIRNFIKRFIKHFKWGFVFAGFTALSMAAISWKMENSESYWIWHSSWHISIYTSSFLFLCSKVDIENFDNETSANGRYELTRQNSSTREEQRHV